MNAVKLIIVEVEKHKNRKRHGVIDRAFHTFLFSA